MMYGGLKFSDEIAQQAIADQAVQYKPLNLVPDAEDLANHIALCDTDLVTRRLGQLVPLVDFIVLIVTEN